MYEESLRCEYGKRRRIITKEILAEAGTWNEEKNRREKAINPDQAKSQNI